MTQTNQIAVVDPDYFWRPMSSCPRGAKVQLLNKGSVAIYGTFNGTLNAKDPEWLGWCPLPKIPKALRSDAITQAAPQIPQEHSSKPVGRFAQSEPCTPKEMAYLPGCLVQPSSDYCLGWNAAKASMMALIAEMKDWEAVAADQAMTIAMMMCEQEPVAWGFQNYAITGRNRWMMLLEDIPANDQYGRAVWTPLYTSPPQRQPLTDAEIMQIELGLRQYNSRDTYDLSLNEFARAIEATYDIKATT